MDKDKGMGASFIPMVTDMKGISIKIKRMVMDL